MLAEEATGQAPAGEGVGGRADRGWRVGGGRLMVYITVYCRAQLACSVAHYRGATSGPSRNKNGPILGQLVENNNHKYAFRKPFQNFGKIRIFVQFQIRGQTVSYPNRLWTHIAYTGPLKLATPG